MTVAPSSFKYFPTSQSSHEALPSLAYLPLAQIAQSTAEMAPREGLYFPATHGVQVSEEVAPEEELYLPFSQFVQVLTVPSEYFPLVHTKQALELYPVIGFVRYFPASQAEHDLEPAPEYFPVPHGSQSLKVSCSKRFTLLSNMCLPAGQTEHELTVPVEY